ncbi:hypothetical protein EVAR_26872_1 [Eumeta japonica]|uniref:Uncharacterized protein n=1 Tax=Eumeta variegata TaxID=151549 RepID=A0A4C1VZ31_EUMVA|nr:hypothetical protein EVAR_26872_1 [Eumeta japonica]
MKGERYRRLEGHGGGAGSEGRGGRTIAVLRARQVLAHFNIPKFREWARHYAVKGVRLPRLRRATGRSLKSAMSYRMEILFAIITSILTGSKLIQIESPLRATIATLGNRSYAVVSFGFCPSRNSASFRGSSDVSAAASNVLELLTHSRTFLARGPLIVRNSFAALDTARFRPLISRSSN